MNYGKYVLGNKKGQELPKGADLSDSNCNADFDGVSLKNSKADKNNHKVKIL